MLRESEFRIFLKEIEFIVIKAGEFILKNFGKVKKAYFKGKRNPVTKVDKESEEKIKKYLKKKFSDIPFLGEELTPDEILQDLYWLVDPLDGTVNFFHKFPIFCVSCALMYKKEPLIGVVYDPVRKELFSACKNKGAFLNKKRIRVSNTKNLSKALLSTGFYYEFENTPDTNVEHFIDFLYSAQGIRRTGSAALDLCYVGCARLDGFWELYLKPWDTAAGSLIVKEAGGRVSKFDGSEFTPFDKEILASNKILHQSMVKILQKKNRKLK